mgnify:CR=1 FL=1
MPTPIDSSLRTGWVVIATEGQSVDGRSIVVNLARPREDRGSSDGYRGGRSSY